MIEAVFDGEAIGETNVVVIIPKAFGTPLPQADSDVTPYNAVADHNSAPPYFKTLDADQVVLWTLYSQSLEVPVNNQFGARLSAVLYYNEEVERKVDGDWRKINQVFSGPGTYVEPVVSFTYKAPDPAVYIVLRSSADAASWPTDTQMAMISDTEPQTFPMRVAGHEIGSTNRKVTATAPKHVKVEWPPP